MTVIFSGGLKGTEDGLILKRRDYIASKKPAILWCHGAGLTPEYIQLSKQQALERMAERGFPCSAHVLGGTNTFLNDLSVTRTHDAVGYMRSTEGATSGKIGIIGSSMGAGTAMMYALAHPTEVAAMALEIPLTSLPLIYAQPAYTSAINAAYGSAALYTAALPTKNPIARAAAIAALGIPIKLWYADDDPIVTKASVQAFAAATGFPAVNCGNAGHNFLTAYSKDMTDWLVTAMGL